MEDKRHDEQSMEFTDEEKIFCGILYTKLKNVYMDQVAPIGNLYYAVHGKMLPECVEVGNAWAALMAQLNQSPEIEKQLPLSKYIWTNMGSVKQNYIGAEVKKLASKTAMYEPFIITQFVQIINGL